MPTPTDPQDRARDAFADLDTPEKTAFVIEATFSTIGQALRETGQRLADVITEFDPESFFRDASGAAPEPRKKSPAKKASAKRKAKTDASTKAAAKKAAATKPAANKPVSAPPPPEAKPTGKTAGRSSKKKDDGA